MPVDAPLEPARGMGDGAIGSLLAVALVVAPAAAARRLATRLGAVLVLGAALAAASGVTGLWAGRQLGVEPSGAVALVVLFLFALASGVGGRPRAGTSRPPDG